MSNHVHYLLAPQNPEDLPKMMHWLNWYTAMCFNRIQNRTGHFWEKRYHSTGFSISDKQRALNTLRYIHANPKAAGMQKGFFYEFSNYGSYECLTNDGLTEWHPAFLQMGQTLEHCAAAYRKFCQDYEPKPKPESAESGSYWGSRFLERYKLKRKPGKKKKDKTSPGQMRLPLSEWEISDAELEEIVRQFIEANCPNSKWLIKFLEAVEKNPEKES
jgi:putative transposase